MKLLKITAITLASILAIIVITISVALYVVLTPSKITPIVEEQIEKQLGFDVAVGEVNLTLFSSFPELRLRIAGVHFAPIARIEQMEGAIDIKRLMGGEVAVNKLYLSGAQFDINTDTLNNMGLLAPAVEQEEVVESEPFSLDINMMISGVEMRDVAVSFADSGTQTAAQIRVPECSITGSLQESLAKMQLSGSMVVDSVNVADTIAVQGIDIKQLEMLLDGSLKSNIFNINATSALHIDSVAMNGETLLQDAEVALKLPATINVDTQAIELHDASMALNELSVEIDGDVKNQADNLLLADLNIKSNRWDFNSIVPLIPASMRAQAAEFTQSGGAVEADIHTFIDLSQAQKSSVAINAAKLELGSNQFSLSGAVDDALNDISCDFDIKAKANIAELVALIPDSMGLNIAAKGIVNGAVNTTFRLEDAMACNIEKIKAKGNLNYNNLQVEYNDTIKLADSRGRVDFALAKKWKSDHILDLRFKGNSLNYNQVGVGTAELRSPSFDVSLSNPMDTTRILSIACDYGVEELRFSSDSITAHLMDAGGNIAMHADKLKPTIPVMSMTYHSDSLAVEMVDMVKARTGNIGFTARSAYDASQEKLLLKWNPLLNVDFNNGEIELAQIEPTIYVPAIKFDYIAEDMVIHDSRIVIQDSDFSLTGNFGNIRSCIDSDEKLIGELTYYSKHTNLDQLMALSQEFMPTEETATTEAATATTTEDEPTPFMIPKKVSIALNTEVESALFNEKPIYDIKGKVVADDGELIMDQVGLRSEAAKMYLTAIYRPERANHLYTGFNFHLVDIDIDALVDIIPAVDTLMPMLKDFRGKGEFHLAAETYLTGRYEPKMSTIRGAMAIKGKDLVLLDGDTFSQISKLLLFSKKARNKVDSLSVEATVFRGEMEIYPFLIAMDRWQGVISGRHNLDMNFNYHVSVVDCPLPVKLGVDIKGNLADMKIGLAPCKYKVLYKPEKQGAVEKQINEFKSIVSNSLIENLKRREDYTPSPLL